MDEDPQLTQVIPAGARRFFVGVLVTAALAGFIYFMISGICDVLNASMSTPPSYSDFKMFLGTALTGLVGAVFALAFGVPVPRQGRGLVRRMRIRCARVGVFAPPWHSWNWDDIIGILYVAAYITAGIAAIVVRFTHDAEASVLIKDVTAAFIGTSLAMVSAFFGLTD